MFELVLILAIASVLSAATESPDIHGMVSITPEPIAAPAECKPIDLPGGDFEIVGNKPSGWDLGGIIVADADAPQGKGYLRFRVPKGHVATPEVSPPSGRPYRVSFLLRSTVPTRASFQFVTEERNTTVFPTPLNVPATGNGWRHVSCYCWMPVQCKSFHFVLTSIEDSAKDEPICVDDVQARSATKAEMAAAYHSELAQLPPRDMSPRSEDGQNLALSIAKWEGRAGIPGKPFVIWAIGSSWTHAQGDGYGLMLAIRERFPHAPPMVYKLHVGPGTPWDFDMGWVRQFVAADQPDLIFTYTNGTAEGLDALLTEIRKHTTADIIIPTIHFNPNAAGWYDRGPEIADVIVPRQGFDPEKGPTSEQIEKGKSFAEEVRAICRKHHAEFVENRRELAEYQVKTGIKPTDLLGDLVHQNLHGQMMVWESIRRHLTQPAQFTYDPAQLERGIAVAPPQSSATEQVTLTGPWKSSEGTIAASTADARVKVRFVGNRIDLLGHRSPKGGAVKVLIDGQPAEQAPVFYMSFIDPDPKKPPVGGKNGAGAVAPHAVDLGTNVVPQSWTITMTSDHGDYRIEGTVTGPDGEGNITKPFHSNSGQISMEPKLWRGWRLDDKGRLICQNRTGDKDTFDVYRCAKAEVSFRGDARTDANGTFSMPLVQNLPKGEYTLEIVTTSDGPVQIDGFYVFTPPE
jgi:hypothetical protein